MKLINYDKFILDNGEIRHCQSNINKMTYIELMIFHFPLFSRRWWKESIVVPIRELAPLLWLVVSTLLLLATFPLSYPTILFLEYNRIKKAQKKRGEK